MTASLRSYDADQYDTSSSPVVPKPAGVVAGDVLFAQFLNNDGVRTLTSLPADWSLIASDTQTTAPSAGFWLCKKVASASEPADYTFGFNFSFNGRIIISAWQDGSDVSVYGAASLAAAGSSSPYNVAASAITVPDDDSKVVFFGGMRTTSTGAAPAYTPPSGYAERVDFGASYAQYSLTIADITQATAGTSGAVTGTVAQASGGAARTVGVLVAIAPASGSSTISLSGEANLPVVTQVVLSSSGESLPAGNYADVPLTVYDQEGVGLAGMDSTETSSDTGIATLAQLADTDSSGQATVRITGVAAGSATGTVTVDGVVSNTVSITVNRAASRIVSVLPATVDLDSGATQTFSASLNSTDPVDFVWTVESGGGTITQAGVYTAPAVATTAIVRATLSTDGAIYAEATVTVTAQAEETGRVTTTWKSRRNGVLSPLAGYTLDYWIISSTDTLITSGSGVTDASGDLTVRISSAYSGQRVLVVVNNLDEDLTTTGKVRGQQVATVQ